MSNAQHVADGIIKSIMVAISVKMRVEVKNFYSFLLTTVYIVVYNSIRKRSLRRRSEYVNLVITLKLLGVIDWSWWWVLMPPITTFVACLMILLVEARDK